VREVAERGAAVSFAEPEPRGCEVSRPLSEDDVVRLVKAGLAVLTIGSVVALFVALTGCGPLTIPPIVIPPIVISTPAPPNPPSPSPSPSADPDPVPTPTPGPVPTPTPTPDPGPVPTPTPGPVPTPSPSPSPSPCVDQTPAPPPSGPTGPTIVEPTDQDWRRWEGTFPATCVSDPGSGGKKYERLSYDIDGEGPDTARADCVTPGEAIAQGRKQGDWVFPPKGFPGENRPGTTWSEAVCGPKLGYSDNPGQKYGINRDADMVWCPSGAVVYPAALFDNGTGRICPPCKATNAQQPVVAATPCPPSPLPPSPPPTPPPAGVDETGNYFLTWAEIKSATPPPRYVNQRSRVGVSLLSRRACSGGGDCEVINIHATEKSSKPYCSHSCYNDAGQFNPAFCRNECETLPSAQYPADGWVEDPPGIWIAHPSWGNAWGVCDKRSSEQESPQPGRDWRKTHICHHRSVNESGILKAMACVGGVTPPATSDGPVPPGCSVTEIPLQ
jgi:hypothetical protein